MKWNRFTLKTKTDAEDMVICTLAEVGIEGVEIQDKKHLQKRIKHRCLWILCLKDLQMTGLPI